MNWYNRSKNFLSTFAAFSVIEQNVCSAAVPDVTKVLVGMPRAGSQGTSICSVSQVTSKTSGAFGVRGCNGPFLFREQLGVRLSGRTRSLTRLGWFCAATRSLAREQEGTGSCEGLPFPSQDAKSMLFAI